MKDHPLHLLPYHEARDPKYDSLFSIYPSLDGPPSYEESKAHPSCEVYTAPPPYIINPHIDGNPSAPAEEYIQAIPSAPPGPLSPAEVAPQQPTIFDNIRHACLDNTLGSTSQFLLNNVIEQINLYYNEMSDPISGLRDVENLFDVLVEMIGYVPPGDENSSNYIVEPGTIEAFIKAFPFEYLPKADLPNLGSFIRLKSRSRSYIGSFCDVHYSSNERFRKLDSLIDTFNRSKIHIVSSLRYTHVKIFT